MKTTQPRDLFPGVLEILILRTLKLRPLHGYALAQYIRRTSGNLLEIEDGSLYPALQRLLKHNLVKSQWGVSSTNRRIRIYSLTPGGAKHLKAEVWSFERMLEGILKVLSPSESV
jgi:PadR family transcriptional regulator, regulatory protein PadR